MVHDSKLVNELDSRMGSQEDVLRRLAALRPGLHRTHQVSRCGRINQANQEYSNRYFGLTLARRSPLGRHDFGQHKHQGAFVKPAQRVQEPMQQRAWRQRRCTC